MARLGPVAAAAAILCLLAASPARGADRVFWGESSGLISFANTDGSGLGDLPTTGATLRAPMGTAIDQSTGRIYWLNARGSTTASPGISFANLDGSGGGDLVLPGVTFAEPTSLAIDPVGRRIYWANRTAAKIGFANLDGPGNGELDTTGALVDFPSGLAVDPEARRIYWVNTVGPDATRISFAGLDRAGLGGSIGTAGAPAVEPIGLAIDPVGQRLYWANVGGDSISVARLDGSGGEELNTTGATLTIPRGVAVDPFAGRVYWANDTTGRSISFANLNGSGGGGTFETRRISTPTFPVLLLGPHSIAAPTISRSTSVRPLLSCARGTWRPDLVQSFLFQAPRAFSYRWSRDGVELAGAVQSTLMATQRGEYRCLVSAQNAAGTATSVSAPFRVGPSAFGDRAEVSLSLVSRRVPAKGPVAVAVANRNEFAVSGTLSARSTQPLGSGRKRRLKVAPTRLRAPATGTSIVRLELPRALRRLLAARGKLSLSLSATVVDPAGSKRTVRKTVVPKLRT